MSSDNVIDACVLNVDGTPFSVDFAFANRYGLKPHQKVNSATLIRLFRREGDRMLSELDAYEASLKAAKLKGDTPCKP